MGVQHTRLNTGSNLRGRICTINAPSSQEGLHQRPTSGYADATHPHSGVQGSKAMSMFETSRRAILGFSSVVASAAWTPDQVMGLERTPFFGRPFPELGVAS
jgi:hypothetical protein